MASTAVKPVAQTRVCGTGCATCRALRDAASRLVTEHGIDQLTSEDLADAVGLTTVQMALHRDGAPHSAIGHAYLEASIRLHDAWAARLADDGTWCGGLRAGMDALLRALDEDPLTARLCFVEVPHGDRELLQLRESVRRRNVDLLCGQYAHHHPGEPVPEIHIELVYGTIVHAIAEAVANGRTAELVERVDEVLAVAGR